MPDRPALDALLEQARRKWAAMSPEEREGMIAAQAASWMRGETAMRVADSRRTGRAIDCTDDMGVKACPFCGAEPYIAPVPSAAPDSERVTIACGRTTCPAQPAIIAPTEAEARLLWNTRKG